MRRFLETVGQDVKFGWRTLRRSPGYAVAAMLILALGIGANTAMFSVIDGVLLKPLPFRAGDELVLVQQSAPGVERGGRQRVDPGAVRLPPAPDGRPRPRRVPLDVVRAAQPGRARPRRHRRRLRQFLRDAGHRARPRPHVHRHGRRPRRRTGAGAQPRLLEREVRRRQECRRQDRRDERPHAHDRRRAARRSRSIRATTTSTCRRPPARSARRASASMQQSHRTFAGAPRVRPARARGDRRSGDRPRSGRSPPAFDEAFHATTSARASSRARAQPLAGAAREQCAADAARASQARRCWCC